MAYGRRAALQKGFSLLAATLFARKALAQTVGTAPIRLLALGDSLTAGYGLARGEGFAPRLQQALVAAGRQVRVIDAGVSGDTMAGGSARLDWAMAERPQAAIVALGANDGLRGLPPGRMAEALESILARLEARGIPVLLAGMLAPPNLGADYGRAFEAVYKDAAAKRPGLLFYPFFLEGVAAQRGLNQADNIHPNPAGVAELVRRILPVTEQLLDRVPPAAAG